MTSVKFWATGSTQGFTANLTDPYINTPPQPPKPLVKDAAELQAAITSWYEAGHQIVMHSNGDASTDLVLAAYKGVFDASAAKSAHIHRIEHATVFRPDQIAEAVRLGLSTSHTIGHVYHWARSSAIMFLVNCKRPAVILWRTMKRLVCSGHSTATLRCHQLTHSPR